MMVVCSYTVETALAKLPVNERIQDIEDHQNIEATRGQNNFIDAALLLLWSFFRFYGFLTLPIRM